MLYLNICSVHYCIVLQFQAQGGYFTKRSIVSHALFIYQTRTLSRSNRWWCGTGRWWAAASWWTRATRQYRQSYIL